MSSDIEIARAVSLKPVAEVALGLGIPAGVLHLYGRHIAKIDLGFLQEREKARDGSRGRLVLVSAVSPTPAGEGKTTTSIGLADGLRLLGKKAVLALREPSLGPCFGLKGGATGGGRAQVAPMERINLHFTGDIHAIESAANLLAALIDNHIHWGNALGIDPRRVFWRRALDVNDRSLRHILQGLEAPSGGGVIREDGFDIAVASEVMAIFCLAKDLSDLQRRLGDIVVAESRAGEPVRARDVGAAGAMSVLLKEALMPNLVQTLEGTPAIIHGGPFANIAHGCNSIIATRAALNCGEIAVTEAGFGADLGAEKFFDIVCPAAGFAPDVAVLVATVRSLKMHGGVSRKNLGTPDPAAVRAGLPNLLRHLANIAKFGVPAVVALNMFPGDSEAEIEIVREACEQAGVPLARATHWAEGGKGALDLAREVARMLEEEPSRATSFRPLYERKLPLADKIRTVATALYGAGEVAIDEKAKEKLARWESLGYGDLPVCMAKTPFSFSADPSLRGAPEGHKLHVRDVRLSAGAGFVVALCGDVITMPGLPRRPAAFDIGLDGNGDITGLS